MNKVLFILLFTCFAVSGLVAQENQAVRVVGQVYDIAVGKGLSYSLMVVNKTQGRGTYGEGDGSFTITINKSDTILLSTRGYKMVKLCFNDSVLQPVYNIEIPISVLHYELNTFTVFAPRDLDEIKKDIDKLGFDKNDYMLSGINAFESPITFLYQALSRKQQKIREAYEYANDMQRSDLLKELFVKYVRHDIIDLEEKQFDEFIEFCHVSDEFLQNTSQYDFIMYVKERYRVFRIVSSDDYYIER